MILNRGSAIGHRQISLFRIKGSPVCNTDGRILRWVGTCTDIHEQKQAEESLRESEARFRSVLDNSHDVIYRLNLQTGRFEYISRLPDGVGYSPDEPMVWMLSRRAR